jgi:hypothetical protein
VAVMRCCGTYTSMRCSRSMPAASKPGTSSARLRGRHLCVEGGWHLLDNEGSLGK